MTDEFLDMDVLQADLLKSFSPELMLSDSELEFLTNDLFEDDVYGAELERLLHDLQEIEDHGTNILQENRVESTDLTTLTENVPAVKTQENVVIEENSTKEFSVPTQSPKIAIQLRQEPKSLIRRQKLINNSKRAPTVTDRPRRILRPLRTKEEVYSKLPCYYTTFATPVENAKESDRITVAYKENIYDKLPSYLTEFVNSKYGSNSNVNVDSFKRTRHKEDNDVWKSTEIHKIKYNSILKSSMPREQPTTKEEKKFVEERRVVHVGNIKRGTDRTQLYHRFKQFGPIEDIKLHYRDEGDCYAFVTFHYSTDAFDAVENGHSCAPDYELSLGGRRLFCLQQYADLDSMNCTPEEMQEMSSRQSQQAVGANDETNKAICKQMNDFDSLLRAAKSNLRK